MTPAEKEFIYDTEIAPELLRLGKRCQEVEMAFVASVEWNPGTDDGGRGRTEYQPPDESGKLSAAQRLVHWAARCNGNVDSFLIAVCRHTTKHGHSSAYLQMLGVPTKPVEASTTTNSTSTQSDQT